MLAATPAMAASLMGPRPLRVCTKAFNWPTVLARCGEILPAAQGSRRADSGQAIEMQ